MHHLPCDAPNPTKPHGSAAQDAIRITSVCCGFASPLIPSPPNIAQLMPPPSPTFPTNAAHGKETRASRHTTAGERGRLRDTPLNFSRQGPHGAGSQSSRHALCTPPSRSVLGPPYRQVLWCPDPRSLLSMGFFSRNARDRSICRHAAAAPCGWCRPPPRCRTTGSCRPP